MGQKRCPARARRANAPPLCLRTPHKTKKCGLMHALWGLLEAGWGEIVVREGQIQLQKKCGKLEGNCGKLQGNCSAITKPPEASRSNTFAQVALEPVQNS